MGLLSLLLLLAAEGGLATPLPIPGQPDRVLVEGAGPAEIPVTLPDVSGFGLRRYWLVRSSRPDVPVDAQPVRRGDSTVVRVRPAPGALGTAVVTLELRDRDWTNQTRFAVTVVPAAFSPVSTAVSDLTGSIADAVDVDADGMLDLVTFDPGRRTVRFAIGEGDGRFRWGPSETGSGIAWTDFDGDGRPEGFLVGRNPPILIGLETNSVLRRMTIPGDLPALRQIGASWLDADDDGDEDLLLTGDGSMGPRRAAVVRNDGGRAFGTAMFELPRTREPPVAGDFDGDGRKDILFLRVDDRETHEVWTRLEEGFGRSGMVVGRPAGAGLGTPVLSSGAVDFDGDGLLDAWAVAPADGWPAGNRMTLWRNDGTNLVVAGVWDGGELGSVAAPVWADFDADGWQDLLLPAPGGAGLPPSRFRWSVRWNRGGRLQAPDDRPDSYGGETDAGSGGPAGGDFNGDGAPDFVAAGSASFPPALRINRLRVANRPPGAPDGLRMAEVPGGVVFTWNRASDPNQSAPLTYNIRVGTTPGGNEVVRSLARPDGVLIVPRAGNCGFQTRRFLRLPRSHGDRLYWSVQSVDAGNVGGVWAREHEEPIGASINTPPRVSGLSDVVAVAGAHLRIPFTVVDDLTPSSLLTVRAWSDDPFRVQVDPGAVGFEADPEAVGAGRRVLGLRLAAGPATRTTVSVLAADYHGAAVVARFVVDAVAPSRIAHLEPVADASESAGAPLRLTGLAGERWLVEESADLREWSPLEEVTVGPDGTLLWVPPASPDPARFFRTRFLAPL